MSTVIVTMSTPDGTGAPKMGSLYAGALRSAGHRVIVACGRLASGEMVEGMRGDGLDVREVPGLEHRNDQGARRSLAEMARAEHAQCLIGFQFRDQLAALWASRGAGVSCVVSAQNRHAFWGPAPVRAMKTMIFARALRRWASLVVCTCDAVRREVLEFGVEPRRVCVLPNAIDVQAFSTTLDERSRDAVRRALGLAPEQSMLLNVGRIDVQKGQSDLLRAFAEAGGEARDARLVMVGDVSTTQQRRMGRYRRELEQFVWESGLESRVIFAGWRDDVPQLLDAADVYVHSARWEGWPLAVMEAMAAGTPTIFTDCAGWPEGFENGRHGHIVPTGDPPALAAAIKTVLAASPASRRDVGRAGRSFAEAHNDIGVVGSRFVELIEGVLA